MAFVLTQKMSVLAPGAPALRASLSSRHAVRSRAPFTVCGAVNPSEDERSPAGKLALPFAGALAAALILGAALPEDALAARCVLLWNNQRLLCLGASLSRAACTGAEGLVCAAERTAHTWSFLV